MNNDILVYASQLYLTHKDIKILKVRDAYSVHRVIYGLFPKYRNEEQTNESSGILWRDDSGDETGRKILILSKVMPHQSPQFGKIKTINVSSHFLNYSSYIFNLKINPVKRLSLKNGQGHKDQPIISIDDIRTWVLNRSNKNWGFNIINDSLDITINSTERFIKDTNKIVYNSATLRGSLVVIDTKRFESSFINGIGRGKAFGFGLLQIVPII